MRNLTEWFSIGSFILLTCTSYLVWPFVPDNRHMEKDENRRLAEMPDIAHTSVSELPDKLTEYINDHMPFRYFLIKQYNDFEYHTFHVSHRVIIGRDGWLFSNEGEESDDPLNAYQGKNLVTDEELVRIADNMIATRDHLRARGTEFIIFIAPNKERVYSEYMPDKYGVPAENYATKQIVDYLRDHTDLTIVYAMDDLMAAKQTLGAEKLLYHKTDTHWNNLGGYVGARSLLQAMGIDIPAPDDTSLTIVQENDVPGDLSHMMGVTPSEGAGDNFDVTGYDKHESECLEHNDMQIIRYQAVGVDKRKIFVHHDSFSGCMEPVISSLFDNSVLVHKEYYQPYMVDDENPDIFIYEMVEKNVPERLHQILY